jgi:hypothetical protein
MPKFTLKQQFFSFSDSKQPSSEAKESNSTDVPEKQQNSTTASDSLPATTKGLAVDQDRKKG